MKRVIFKGSLTSQVRADKALDSEELRGLEAGRGGGGGVDDLPDELQFVGCAQRFGHDRDGHATSLLGSGVFPVGILASVEVDVLGGNVGGVDRVVGAAEVEIDGDPELLLIGDGVQFVEVGLGDEAAFAGGFAVVGNVDEFLADAGPGIADGR